MCKLLPQVLGVQALLYHLDIDVWFHTPEVPFNHLTCQHWDVLPSIALTYICTVDRTPMQPEQGKEGGRALVPCSAVLHVDWLVRLCHSQAESALAVVSGSKNLGLPPSNLLMLPHLTPEM